MGDWRGSGKGPEGESRSEEGSIDRGGHEPCGGVGDSAEEHHDPALIGDIISLNHMLRDATRWLALAKRSTMFGAPVASKVPVGGMATSEQLDSFRELRTRLILMAESAGLTHFTTLIVPMTEDSGASFVARNLAAAFSLQEQRIALLLDCNFREPAQHEALGSHDDGSGLLDFLDGGAHGEVERLILPTAIPGLHLIPAGRSEAVLSGPQREHFSSNSMKGLMARLRAEPCYVFLDGPAMQGSPDARILSDLADFVVLVVGYGRSTNKAIAQAAAVFDSNKFVGVVFNERAKTRASKPPGFRKVVTRQGGTARTTEVNVGQAEPVSGSDSAGSSPTVARAERHSTQPNTTRSEQS